MKGKTVLITGTNTGIGRATALALAGMGAEIVMFCRNQESGQKAMEEIKKESGNPDIDLLVADLSLQADVRRAAAEFAAKYAKLHVLINNAGVILPHRLVTGDGLECTLAVNYLAPFLLTNLLLDSLKAAAPARIINVASGVQMGLDFADLQGEKRYMFRLILSISGPLMRSPKKGAQTPVYLASSPEIENATGQYFVNCRPVKSSASTYDKSAARRLWDIGAELTKLDINKEERT